MLHKMERVHIASFVVGITGLIIGIVGIVLAIVFGTSTTTCPAVSTQVCHSKLFSFQTSIKSEVLQWDPELGVTNSQLFNETSKSWAKKLADSVQTGLNTPSSRTVFNGRFKSMAVLTGSDSNQVLMQITEFIPGENGSTVAIGSGVVSATRTDIPDQDSVSEQIQNNNSTVPGTVSTSPAVCPDPKECDCCSCCSSTLSTITQTTATPITEVFFSTSTQKSTDAPSTKSPVTIAPTTGTPSTTSTKSASTSTNVPSTKVSSTTITSTVLPSTDVPSTPSLTSTIPSTVMTSTLASSTVVSSTNIPTTTVPSTTSSSSTIPSTSTVVSSTSPTSTVSSTTIGSTTGATSTIISTTNVPSTIVSSTNVPTTSLPTSTVVSSTTTTNVPSTTSPHACYYQSNVAVAYQLTKSSSSLDDRIQNFISTKLFANQDVYRLGNNGTNTTQLALVPYPTQSNAFMNYGEVSNTQSISNILNWLYDVSLGGNADISQAFTIIPNLKHLGDAGFVILVGASDQFVGKSQSAAQNLKNLGYNVYTISFNATADFSSLQSQLGYGATVNSDSDEDTIAENLATLLYDTHCLPHSTTVGTTTLASTTVPSTGIPSTVAATTIVPSTVASSTVPSTTVTSSTATSSTVVSSTLASTSAVPSTSVSSTISPSTVVSSTVSSSTLMSTSVVPSTVVTSTAAPTTSVSSSISPTTLVSSTVSSSTLASTSAEPSTAQSSSVAPTTLVSSSISPSTIVSSTVSSSTLTSTSAAPSTVVSSTVPSSTLASTSALPSTVVSSTAASSTTVQSSTISSTVAPSTTAPSTSAPSTVVPSTSAPSTTVPSTTSSSSTTTGCPQSTYEPTTTVSYTSTTNQQCVWVCTTAAPLTTQPTTTTFLSTVAQSTTTNTPPAPTNPPTTSDPCQCAGDWVYSGELAIAYESIPSFSNYSTTINFLNRTLFGTPVIHNYDLKKLTQAKLVPYSNNVKYPYSSYGSITSQESISNYIDLYEGYPNQTYANISEALTLIRSNQSVSFVPVIILIGSDTSDVANSISIANELKAANYTIITVSSGGDSDLSKLASLPNVSFTINSESDNSVVAASIADYLVNWSPGCNTGDGEGTAAPTRCSPTTSASYTSTFSTSGAPSSTPSTVVASTRITTVAPTVPPVVTTSSSTQSSSAQPTVASSSTATSTATTSQVASTSSSSTDAAVSTTTVATSTQPVSTVTSPQITTTIPVQCTSAFQGDIAVAFENTETSADVTDFLSNYLFNNQVYSFNNVTRVSNVPYPQTTQYPGVIAPWGSIQSLEDYQTNIEAMSGSIFTSPKISDALDYIRVSLTTNSVNKILIIAGTADSGVDAAINSLNQLKTQGYKVISIAVDKSASRFNILADNSYNVNNDNRVAVSQQIANSICQIGTSQTTIVYGSSTIAGSTTVASGSSTVQPTTVIQSSLTFAQDSTTVGSGSSTVTP